MLSFRAILPLALVLAFSNYSAASQAPEPEALFETDLQAHQSLLQIIEAADGQRACTEGYTVVDEEYFSISWPEDLCKSQYSALTEPSETYSDEICRFWPYEIYEVAEQEAFTEEALPLNVGGLSSYTLNPLALKSVERNMNMFKGSINDRFALWLARSGKYLKIMKEIIKEEGLPEDIAYLPLIESGFNTRAYSRSRAVGPWQFIAGTGKRYGLKIDWWVDERRDPVKATRAAARYLRDLHDMFGSWSLAMAAYNAGENKIKRAIRRTGSDDYWGLLRTRHIKRETKDYVPKFIAARLIAAEPEKHGFSDIPYMDEFVYDEATIQFPMTMDVIASCAGTTVEEVRELNPELTRWSTPPVASYTLRVPLGSKETFLKNLEAVPPEKRVTVREYRVRKGDTISEISKRLGVTQDTIIRYNKLNRRGLIHPGQVLLVPMDKKAAVDVKHLPSVSLSDGHRGKVYTVRLGDALSGISKITGVSISRIISANKLGGSSLIMAGQKLFIPYN